MCLNLGGLSNEMSPEGARNCAVLLHEYQLNLQQSWSNTLLSVKGQHIFEYYKLHQARENFAHVLKEV